MRKPNILHILIDDLGCRDLTCFGSSFYETPHLDALAAGGMLFADAYATCPVCSPTRASIMTGRYPARVGITQWIGGHSEGKLRDVPYLYFLPKAERSLATALRDGGYATWHVGKWHLGGWKWKPQGHGFDVNVAGFDWGMPKKGYFSPWHMEDLEDGPEGEYLTDRLTDEAIKLIRERDPAKPFFLDLSHYAVHTPIQAPPDLIPKYEAKAAAMGLDPTDAWEQGEEFPCLHKWGRFIRRRKEQSDPVYAAMVENLDTNIGRVLAVLEEEGIADDTIVAFTSDNGGLSTAEGCPTCNLPMIEGKGWMYEGGTRVCQIIRWPGVVAPGSVSEVPVQSCDFYPTYLAAAGLDPLPEQHCDGVDLGPVLRGEGGLDREDIFWHYPHYGNQGGTPGASIRAGDWKLIEFYEDNHLELYNLREDVSETTNLVEAKPELARELHARLDAWREEVAAIIPRKNPEYARIRAEFEATWDPAEV